MTHWIQTIFCTAVGTAVGLSVGLNHSKVDDVIKAKRILVVDDEGQTMVNLSDAGITVSGEKKGDFSQIRAGQIPSMTFFENGKQRTAVGILEYGDFAGLATYQDGSFRSVFGSAGGTSAMALYAGPGTEASEEITDAYLKSVGAVRILATTDETSELMLYGKKGGSKVLSNSSKD